MTNGTATQGGASQVSIGFRPHEKQAQFLAIKKSYKLALFGHQCGKTVMLAAEMVMRIIEAASLLSRQKEILGNAEIYSAMAVAIVPSNVMVKDILLPAYDQIFSSSPELSDYCFGKGKAWQDCYNKSEQVLEFPGLPFPLTLLFRSSEDGDQRLRGLSRVIAAHCDEAAIWCKENREQALKIWAMLRDRVATAKGLAERLGFPGALGNISVCTTPMNYDWTFEAIEQFAATGHTDYGFVHATSWETPYRSDKELQELLETTPPWLVKRNLLALRDVGSESLFPDVRNHVGVVHCAPVRESSHEVVWEPVTRETKIGATGRAVPIPDGTLFIHSYDVALTGDFCVHLIRTVDLPSVPVKIRMWHPKDIGSLLDYADIQQGKFPGTEVWDQTGLGEGAVDQRKRKDGFRVVGIKISSAPAKMELLKTSALRCANGANVYPPWERCLQEHLACDEESIKKNKRLHDGSHYDIVMSFALGDSELGKPDDDAMVIF